jgi:hypothetical protein
MKNEILHDDLDDFLKNTFESHTIVPGDELWAKIGPQVTLNMVPHSKYVRMKYAFIAAAASFVAVVFLLFAQNTSLFGPKKPDNLSVAKNSGLPNLSTVETETKEKEASHPEIPTAHSYTHSSRSKIKEVLKANYNLSDQSTRLAIVSSEANKDSWNNSENKISDSEPICIDEIERFECLEVVSTENYPSNTDSRLIIPGKPAPVTEKAATANRDHRKSASSFHFPKIDLSSVFYSNSRAIFRQSRNRNAGVFDLPEFLKKLEVGFNYSPMLSSRTLWKNQITENGNIDRQYFNDIEKALLTNNFGLDLLYHANDQWSFRTGFYFTQYRHETQNDALHRDVVSPEQLILNTSAGKIPVYGTGMDQLPPLSVFNAKINLSYVEVPLVARYYWNPHFFTEAEMNYSYLKSSKTNITTEDYTGAFSYSGVEGLLKHTFAVNIGFGLDYKLNSRLKFEIGPEVKWQVNSLVSNSMVTHPLYWGIRAGVRFKWRNPGYRN